MECIAPGVWKIRLGQPDKITPASLLKEKPRLDAMKDLPAIDVAPIDEKDLDFKITPRGVRLEMPIADAAGVEQFFGLGLQLGRMNLTGRKRTLRVNSDPLGEAGDSHSPVPFVVSNAGWGVYVDTARYATFYMGSHRKRTNQQQANAVAEQAESERRDIAITTDALYATRSIVGRKLMVEVPSSAGVDVYFFAGPGPMEVVQRYNLLSGGGCLPPMWGLGVWYRAFGKSNQEEARALAASLRKARIPCDVFGLEPGWQSQAYPCSFVWDGGRFPTSDELIGDLRAMGFNINLWEHVFVHPSSPIHKSLQEYSGDYEIWGGLLPDLTIPKARQIFGDYHRKTFVEKGITGFKLDECDNSDFIPSGNWSFPEVSTYPSGLDGEQMHCLLGLEYQRTIMDGFEACNTRTYSEVRCSGGMASALPYVLYSDLYGHRDFVRGVPAAGFSGILWTPEVRDARSPEDLIRRIQSVILSPQALINAWYIKSPPWLQYDMNKNNAGQMLENAAELESVVRDLLQLRMRLLPYLYAAFAKYQQQGRPPFRALVMDYPTDQQTYKVEDQYMMGDDLIVAPLFRDQVERQVYLPAGRWYRLESNQSYEGAQAHTITASLNEVIVMVKSGTILPMAKSVDFVSTDEVFEITPQAYGPAGSLRSTELYEDDGLTFDYRQGAFGWVTIGVDGKVSRRGNAPKARYKIGAIQRFE